MSCVQREYHLVNSNTKKKGIKHIAKHGRKFSPKKKSYIKKNETEMRNYFRAKTQHPNNMRIKSIFIIVIMAT